ncbi:hypothetical protein NDU88_007288 [Pleurodeles waltl]|uniref:Uncharacterized protein n=1 Tax=Pleurodeles waltl TaxID=8319 RepID=A0AAV7VQB4_PLEWA|nr:hypothetical protein NDU88_007288 [Pleurodeles waltl]
MLEILAADAEIACGLDGPVAGGLGVAPAGGSGHRGVRLGHGDAAEASGGSQAARVHAGQRCGPDRPGAGVLGGGPGWRVRVRRRPVRTQCCRCVGRRQKSEQTLAGVIQRAREERRWRDERFYGNGKEENPLNLRYYAVMMGKKWP